MLSASEQEDSKGGSSFKDERFWQPTVDKAGNGFAVIRLLPACEGNELPWVRYWSHGFKGPTGMWYIENSRTSIGESDPVAEMNTALWNKNDDPDCPLKAIVRERKRKLHYVSNILVVSDPKNPENEGKVFLYKYGKKIHDKIMDVMQPQFEDETPIDPFDFWEGADFKLKIRKVDGYRNYDKSEFATSEALYEDDSELEVVYNKLYDLNEFSSPNNYKSYDELASHLKKVLGQDEVVTTPEQDADLDREEAPRKLEEVSSEIDFSTDDASSVDEGEPSELEEDGAMSYFANLAKED